MISQKLHKVLAPSMAIALALAPLVMTGCGGSTDAPTDADMDAAAHNESSKKSDSASAGGGGGAGAPADGGSEGGGDGSTAYDDEGNPILQTEAGDVVIRTSADGNYATNDFIEGSAIYGRKTASVTNDYQFVTDGIGTWELVALKDADGYVFSGDELKPGTLAMTPDNFGTITVNGEENAFGWQQYKDFPQLALGDIGKRMTLTMEINDDGMLTVRQDADGQVMLFRKTNDTDNAVLQSAQQTVDMAQEPVDQAALQEQAAQTPEVVVFGDEATPQQ